MSFFNRNPMSGAMPPLQQGGNDFYGSFQDQPQQNMFGVASPVTPPSSDPYDIYGVFGSGDPLESVDLFGGAPQAPQAPQPYQDPYSGYQDPYAGYEDPYASYQDPYAGYQDPFSDIDLFDAGQSGQQGSMFGAPMGYMPPPMPSTTAPGTGGPAAPAPGTGGPAAPAPGTGDTVYAGGTPGFDERTGQYTQQPPQGGDGGASLPPPIDRPTFFAGDKPFATRQEAIDYARNVLGNPNAVELRNPVDPAAAQQTFTFATPEQLASAQGYFGVGDKRFVDRDEASRYAAAMGTTGGPMLFSRMGEGELNVTGPQAQIDRRLTDAEQQARRVYRERRAREREEQRLRNERRTASWNSLIEAQRQAQQNVDPNNFYYIDSPTLGELKFASFDDAKRFLEKFNTGGDESITDVYDKSQRSGLPTSFSKIKSSGGDKTRYEFSSSAGRHGESFATREEAADYIRNKEMAKRRQRALDMINFGNRSRFKPGSAAYRDLSDYDLSTEEGMKKLTRKVGAGKAEIIKNLLDTDYLEDQINRRLAGESASTAGVGQGLRIRQFSEGGAVTHRIRLSDIKHFRRGGPVGSFVERR